jgi:hypothetical protein
MMIDKKRRLSRKMNSISCKFVQDTKESVRHSGWVTLITLLVFVSLGMCQESLVVRHDDVMQGKLIKVKRMAEEWRDAPVELKVYAGTSYPGRFISIVGSDFQLQTERGLQQVPVVDVRCVVLKRRLRDLTFVGLTTVGTAALFAGAISLSSKSNSNTVGFAALVGGGLGFFTGWKAFYQDTEIKLE